jgi:hypothetical protein
MKAIDILLEDPFGPDVQRDSGLIIPKEVQDQIDAEAAKVRQREAAIKAQEQEAAEKRARREAKAKEYFRKQADTDATRARERAEAEKNARRAKREKRQFDLLRKQAQDTSKYSPTTILFGDEIESTMSKEDFKKWLKKNRQHYKQYVKPFEKVKRFNLIVRVLTGLGVSLMQLNEIWEDYNAVKTLYHMEPQQITQETHDFYMQYLDYQMLKVVIPAIAGVATAALLKAGGGLVTRLKWLQKILAGVGLATGVGWIAVVLESIAILSVEYFLTSKWFERNAEEMFRALLAHYIMGYSDEDIARLEKDINLQVAEEKRQALAAQVGEKSDKERFLELMRRADPAAGGGTIY